jgi:hypothetical protein
VHFTLDATICINNESIAMLADIEKPCDLSRTVQAVTEESGQLVKTASSLVSS